MGARRRACDSCYQRKIQCDAASTGPQCSWCQSHKLACTYDRPVGRKVSSRSKFKPKSKSEETLALIKRLEHVEERIAQFRSGAKGCSGVSVDSLGKPSPATIQSEAASPASRVSIAESSNSPFGLLFSPNGFPYFTPHCEQWIDSKTGEWPRFHEFNSDEEIFPPAYSKVTAAVNALPSRSTLTALVREFFRCGFSRCFPFVNRILFEETTTLAYTMPGSGGTRAQMSARACVFAFSAIVCTKFPHAEGADAVDGDACMQEVELILTRISGYANITTLQTLLMLCIYKAQCGQVAAAAMHHAAACRIVFVLGGHRHLPRTSATGEMTLEERQHHQTRLLFWLCYIFDKEATLRSGHPPIIPDDYCDLTLPDGYLESIFGERRTSYDPDEEQTPLLISDLRLVIIKSKVAKELYSVASLKKSDAELLLTIRELDEELEKWRLSIPAEFAPSLSIRKDFKLVEHLEQSGKMLQIELHMVYHHLLSIIHWASGRCVISRNHQDRDTSFGLRSSLDLSVEASRSTVIFLSVAGHRLASDAFWIFAFYPISAFMSLFFNLLRNPDSEYAELDMELLSSSSQTIRNMPRRLSAVDDAAFLAKIDAFVEETTRLAGCAVAKRRRETGLT